MTSLAAPTPALHVADRTPARRFILVITVAGVLFGLVAGELVAGGHATKVPALAVVLLPVLVWKKPHLAPVVIIAGALMIEQFGQSLTPGAEGVSAQVVAALNAPIPVTPQIPLFHGLGSLHLSPADFLLVMLLGIYLAKTPAAARPWPRSSLTVALRVLLGAVVLGIVMGLMHHGQIRVSLMETRPYLYMASTYVLVSMFVTSRSAVRAVLWAIVLTIGLKAFQGLYVFAKIRNMHPRPEAVLGHEEAFFFSLFILLTLALWLFDVREGRLRKTATWLLPVVLAADLANNRRAAWIVLVGGLLVLLALGLKWLPARRRLLMRCTVVTVVCSAIYLPMFWNHGGGLAQPARALRSMVAPDQRDALSDLYRIQENANLNLNIREGGLLGKGFGVPIDYALPIADIKNIDPFINFIPHNGVLYILMRMGILGGIAFWALLAVATITGSRLAGSGDPEFALVGALLACAMVGYAMEGGVDQGFFFYRIAFVVGSLLGLAEAASRLQRMSAGRAA